MAKRKDALCKNTIKKTSNSPIIIIFILALLLMLFGIGIFAYPSISNYLAEQNHVEAITTYNEAVEKLDKTALKKAWKSARKYNETLAGDPVHDPFLVGSGYALPENYLSVLNLNNDGIMGYIEIPKISIKLPIYHGTSDEVLEKGVGHIQQTALPIGGKYRHSVLTGHRGLPSAELFTRLDELKIGDYIYISVLNKTLAYKVREINTVLPDDLSNLTANKDEDLITLVTCTPYAVNTHRLLVTCERTKYLPPDKVQQTDSKSTFFGLYKNMQKLGIIIGVTIAAIAVIITVIVIIVKKRKKKGNYNENSKEKQ